MWQQPRIGETVHYVSHGTPIREDGTQAFASQCRAAIVTAVKNATTVDLFVMNPTGVFLNQDCYYFGREHPEGLQGGTWHNLGDCES